MAVSENLTVTIASGATASSSIQTSQYRGGSYQIPAAFTGTTITVQVSNDDSTFTAVDVEGNEVSADTVAVGGSYPLPLKTFLFKFFRLVSGSAEGAARVITIFMRE